MNKGIVRSYLHRAILASTGLLFFTSSHAQTTSQLWGMTSLGGDSGGGAIFQYDIQDSSCNPQHYFTGPNASPRGDLIQASDGNFYGMTLGGGASGVGTIFKCTLTGEETVIYSFAGGTSDGASPYGSLIQGSDGNFYGMTSGGGTSNGGTIFKCTTSGTETILHSFSRGTSDGYWPYGSLIQGSDGNLYGTTFVGGASMAGIVFKCTTSGIETILHTFSRGTSDGVNPCGSLIQCRDGNLYGMTTNGGTSGAGTIFKCTTTGTESIVYAFTGGCCDCICPNGSLTQGSDGNLYGMTTGTEGSSTPGTLCYGAIFKCTTTGAETVLYDVAFSGSYPNGSLIQASDGNFYGMISYGEWMGGDQGVIFQLSLSGTISIIYGFAGGTSDGALPYGSLIQATDGDLYGMTSGGGISGIGTIFKCATTGAESLLYSFVGDFYGATPYGSLITDMDSNLYGMTSQGGTSKSGTIFKYTPSGTKIILHNFTGVPNDYNGGKNSDGALPNGSLIQGNDSNLYGMTSAGGSPFLNGGCSGNSSGSYGTIFKCTTTGTETILHVFTGGATDGEYPYGNLIQGSDGNLYGMTFEGGSSGAVTWANANAQSPLYIGSGTLFKCTPSGNETIIYNFGTFSGDGTNPYGSLIQDTDGNFYGMTSSGGSSNHGTIFKCTPAGAETILHNFAGGASDGTMPYGSVVKCSDGNLYGMTTSGGPSGNGILFKCTTTGIETLLHNFAGGDSDGAMPYGSLIQGSDGNLYGMTSEGGTSNSGTVFKCTLSGTFTLLNSLTVSTGGYPHGDLLELKKSVSQILPQIDKTVVYPNPNKGIFTVHSSSSSNDLLFEVYTLLGKKIFVTNLTNESNTIINLSIQSTGLYLYRVITLDEKIMGQGKIIIQK